MLSFLIEPLTQMTYLEKGLTCGAYSFLKQYVQLGGDWRYFPGGYECVAQKLQDAIKLNLRNNRFDANLSYLYKMIQMKRGQLPPDDLEVNNN